MGIKVPDCFLEFFQKAAVAFPHYSAGPTLLYKGLVIYRLSEWSNKQTFVIHFFCMAFHITVHKLLAHKLLQKCR